MPAMGGRKCVERLLEIKPELKAIAISGDSSVSIVEDISKSGTTVFVEKPYQHRELLRTRRQVRGDHPQI